MSDRTKITQDHQFEHVRIAILKQSPDGQPFWLIPDPYPSTIDACREFSVESSMNMKYYAFRLPRQHNIARGDLLINAPSIVFDSHEYAAHGVRLSKMLSWYHLVEYVSVDNTSCIVVAKQINCYDIVRLPDRIYLTNDDFIKLHKPNPIDDLDAFVASLTTKGIFQPSGFAILKQSSDGQPFWLIPSSLSPKAYTHLIWESMNYHLFRLFGQHNIARGDLLKGSSYYLVKQVSIKETSCFVFAKSVDVVESHDKIYLENDFIQSHKPKPINDLAEFVASMTIGDAFDNRWPFKVNRANIYIFRDKDFILYVGSSTNVYKRIRAHLGIKMRNSGHFKLYVLIKNNLPNSRNWNIDLYRVNSANDGGLVRHEMQIIKRLCPIINAHGNPCPMPLPTRYKCKWLD